MTLLLEDQEPTCKGLYFRCAVTSWLGCDLDINFQTRYRFLKRMSCSGCDECGYLWDDISERLGDAWMAATVLHEDAADGKIYRLKVTNISTDWETGYVDDYDLEFVRHETDD